MPERRYYSGPPEKQPKDCGRPHPQPICMCVQCEIAALFKSIEDKQNRLAHIRAIKRTR